MVITWKKILREARWEAFRKVLKQFKGEESNSSGKTDENKGEKNKKEIAARQRTIVECCFLSRPKKYSIIIQLPNLKLENI